MTLLCTESCEDILGILTQQDAKACHRTPVQVILWKTTVCPLCCSKNLVKNAVNKKASVKWCTLGAYIFNSLVVQCYSQFSYTNILSFKDSSLIQILTLIMFVGCEETKDVTSVAQIMWPAISGAAWFRVVAIYSCAHVLC